MKKDFVSLAEARPDLAKEWNYEKNGDLRPEDVSCGSNKKVWWKLPYDVPDDYPVEHLRGKHFEFEWEATIYSRNDGRNCPYLKGKAICPGFNDLATTNPELAAQWHPTKNGDLRPSQVAANSNRKVWWTYSHNDKTTGKHFEFEWKAAICSRNNGASCPYLSGKAVNHNFNDLATINPELATQWHPTKNGDLKPSQVTTNTNKKVWWLLSYDVPDDYPIVSLRGKHFDFEWEAGIGNRNKGTGCPYLSGRAVYSGFNDLATTNPKLAAQWHPTKNGDLRPSQVAANSNRKVWWICPYDDTNTGKHFDFEWQALISDRNSGSDCPYLNGQAVWAGFNDLETTNPELAAQWHPTKNKNLKPTQVTANSSNKIWWICPYDDPKTKKHFDFEWESIIANRNSGIGCPYLSGQSVWYGFNDLATINPELAAQWHPTKNKDLKPTQIAAKSNKKVWWLYHYDDPTTGKHFDFEWKAEISSRNSGIGCPYLSGKAVWSGFNYLATTNPELAAQWHPTKNGNLKPTQVTANSQKKVWWLLLYDDPDTGKHFDFEWQAIIKNRNKGNDCVYLTGKAVLEGFNDLTTINPELAAQWHPTKNGDLKPTQFIASSEKKVWWLLPYDDPNTGKHFDFEWQALISNRNSGNDCPYLNGKAVWPGFNDLATINPELAAQWHPTKNGDLKPTQITAGSRKKVWWLLSYDVPMDYSIEYLRGKHFDFEWKHIIGDRNRGNRCPYLIGKAVWEGFNDLQTTAPELAAQWHPTKNWDLKPTQITAGSQKKVWWLLSYDVPMDYPVKALRGRHFDFEWQAVVNSRKNNGCPYLAMHKGEEYIKQYLQKNNISFNTQQKFSDLLGTGDGQLSYDFSIPNEKYGHILIEYNGIQHYEAVDYFGGEEQFKKQKEHDKRKRDYAKKHGYKLITIKYTYDTYESVEEYLDKELKKLGVINSTKKEESVNDAA